VEGLFPALRLSDDQKMNGLLESLDRQKNDQSNALLFPAPDNGRSTAFALVAHGYVTVLFIVKTFLLIKVLKVYTSVIMLMLF
jgi:hypothetical protein